MWLQLSPVLPKDILRAKHPCRWPPTPKLPMKSYTSQQWRGMDLLRCDWGPMPSSFRTQFLKDPCNATGSPALPPWAQATIHRGLTPQEETGGLLCGLQLFGSASGAVSNNGAFPLLPCSDKNAVVWEISQTGTTPPNLSVFMAGSLNASLQFLISTQWSSMYALSFLHLSLFPKVPSRSKAYFSCQVISLLIKKKSNLLPVLVLFLLLWQIPCPKITFGEKGFVL